jgi:hypothetical protein
LVIHFTDGSSHDSHHTPLTISQLDGERDKRHGTILVQALVRRGMLHDAWQGLLISEETVHLLSAAYRELLMKVMRLVSPTPYGAPHARSASPTVESTKRKLDSKQRVEVIAFCVYALMKITPTAIT